MRKIDYDEFLHDVKNLPDNYICKKYGIVVNLDGTVYCTLTKHQYRNIIDWLNTTSSETNEHHYTAA